MNTDWKQDSRLKNMNPKKLAMLNEFAKRVETTPKHLLVSTLLSLNAEATRNGLSFTDEETDLLISIMGAHMSEEERKRLEAVQAFSKNAKRRK